MSHFSSGLEVSYFTAGHLHLNEMMKRGFQECRLFSSFFFEALMFYVWILISSSDNQPLLKHSRLRLLPFSPPFYSIGLSLTTLLSVSSHFLQVFLCAFLSFYTSWKGLIPFFFFFKFLGCFSEFLPCPRPVWEVGSPTLRGPLIFLLVILWVQALNQPPRAKILPPPSLPVFVVSPAVHPDEEGLIWGTLVLMWRPECQKWRLCVEVWGPEKRQGPPGINLSLMFADAEKLISSRPYVTAITQESDPTSVIRSTQCWAILINPWESS